MYSPTSGCNSFKLWIVSSRKWILPPSFLGFDVLKPDQKETFLLDQIFVLGLYKRSWMAFLWLPYKLEQEQNFQESSVVLMLLFQKVFRILRNLSEMFTYNKKFLGKKYHWHIHMSQSVMWMRCYFFLLYEFSNPLLD